MHFNHVQLLLAGVLAVVSTVMLLQQGSKHLIHRSVVRPRAVSTSSVSPMAQTALPEAAIKERAKAALLGGLVADAATMPLHWIYDQTKLKDALAQRPGADQAPEFHTPHGCPFYQAPLGDLSPYGYELYALAKYLAEARSPTSLDGTACAKSLAASYSASTGYLNKSSKHVKEAVAEGKSYPETGLNPDPQANSFVKAPAVVALLAGKPELRSMAEVAVRVQQNDEDAVAAGIAGAVLLEKVVLGSSVSDAVEWALSPASGLPAATQDHLRVALGLKAEGYTDSVGKLGASCRLPSSLQASVLGAAKFGSYVDAVRANILAGGDNASRSVLLGALLAAQEGAGAIPAEWKQKTRLFSEYEAIADQILALRG